MKYDDTWNERSKASSSIRIAIGMKFEVSEGAMLNKFVAYSLARQLATATRQLRCSPIINRIDSC